MIVLITGASSGFGRLLAERLAGTGHSVFGTSRAPDSSEARAFTLLPLDVRDDGAVARCVEEVTRRAGAVDVLVNNAGYVHEGPLEELALDELKALFETNFFGAVRMTSAVLPAMRARRSGRIVNVSSMAGLMPIPFAGAYCATKHALESYSESLRHELMPMGIAVHVVEPGFFKTGISARKLRTRAVIADYDAQRSRMYDAFAREEERSPPPGPVIDLLVRLVEGRHKPLRHPIGREALNWRLRGLLPEWVWEKGVRRNFRLD